MRNLLFQQRFTVAAFAILSLLMIAGYYFFSITLSKTSFASGTILLICIFILASYQLRKTFSFLSMGSTSAWLQFHIFIGLFSCLLFALHVKFRIPNGFFETLLFLSYLTVFLSGVIGWFLSRSIPYRLSSRGEEVIFERIPIHRRNILDKVESLVFDNQDSAASKAIPDFYQKHLQAFFEGPSNLMRHILHSERHRHHLSQKITAMKPFLNEQEQITMQQIVELIQQKDDLDYQYALQALLKLWLFVHVPLTYSLILFALFHTIAVCAFASTSG
ncbi:hypothetical protein [Gimesia aquarii]|uniref:Ferric reductase like transmembrane component n=1 Tax=Gimesia aquarii TaxID=2527964 RepID=A0A517WUU1_9PLAN|nr:hypothetical protein [Gimesia aquarii]QDU09021.1 hypothetical protein V202x_23910 [Gimesia aquarii]